MARPAPRRKATLAEPDSLDLTPLRAHYLKRELVALQLEQELNDVGITADPLACLGPPFNPPKAQPSDAAPLPDLVFLRFFFRAFVQTFPFLQKAPNTFYSAKLQPFVASFLARNISTSDDREEETKRKRLAGKLEKHLGLILSSAIKLADNDGHEEVIRVTSEGPITAPVGSDVLSQTTVPTREKALPPLPPGETPLKDFEVNVATIRNVIVKGRLRNKTHEEFVILVKRKGKADLYVSRRYGDFARLAEKLRSEFPEQDIRPPPPKDRRTVEARPAGSNPPTPPSNHGRFPSQGSQGSPRSSGDYGRTTPLSPPSQDWGQPGSATSMQSTFSASSASLATSGAAPTILARERNRLTLRAYIRLILATPNVANSTALRDFLLDQPIILTDEEMVGVEMREEMDRTREAELAQFRSEVDDRVKELETHLRWFREELVKRDGLRRVFGMIRTTPKVEDLPIEYRKVLEWARISLASTIYQMFVGSDNSSSVFQQLKRMHGLMPYMMMRGILRISNPVAMIRGILDLFLARPFGQTSLVQRMFSSGMTEEVRELKQDMEMVSAKIPYAGMTDKILAFVNAPREIQNVYRSDAKEDKLDLMTVILRSDDTTLLDRSALMRLGQCDAAYQEYQATRNALDNVEDDEGPTNDDAWLYEDLHVYMRLASRLRDKEQMIELIFEGSTSELLKDMVTIFYQPLAQVYKAANIADSIYDLQMFLNDLIKTVEQAENAGSLEPQRTVQTFVDLVARHEGAFYSFVHQVHTKGSELFDDLMIWIERIINFVRDGLPETISLDYLLPAGPTQRREVLAEIDAIVEYHRRLKEAHHERMRRRFVRGEVRDVDHDAAFVDGVMKNLDLGTVAGDVIDIAAAESDEDLDDDDVNDDSSEEFVDAEADTPVAEKPLAFAPMNGEASAAAAPPAAKPSKRKRKKDRVVLEAPVLVHLPRIAPVFVELLRPSLQG